jgi:N-acetylmuramoyl-L-alanine amidase
MKNILKFIGLAFLTITFAFTSSDKKVIVIDVSHGGQDNGISIGKLNEKEITLNIAKKIKEQNKNANVEIILTRDSDKFVTLNERTENINALKPDFIISLHVSSSEDKNKNGMEIVVSNKNKQKDKSTKLALYLLNSFDKHQAEIKNADLYLLKNVNYPIALVELGYLTNDKDREVLTSENGQLELVTSILNAIK